MSMKWKRATVLGAGVALCAALAAGNVQAQETSGYAVNTQGNILRSGSGDCVHTGFWAEGDATLVGCDGVVLEVEIEVIEGQPSGQISVIAIPAAKLFGFDKADVTDEGRETLEAWRKTVQNELSDAFAAIIIGHTDSTGDASYNMGLSKRRAEAVSDYLVATGTPADKLRVIGKGESNPLASNDTKEGQALNRRVEIIIIGEARALDTMLLPSVALFPRRSAELTAQGKALIEENRDTALSVLSRATYIELIGHTDDVGDDDYNQDLSEQRAESMRDYLVETGGDPSIIFTRGAGEKMPIATNKTAEGRAENRRVEVLVLGRVKP